MISISKSKFLVLGFVFVAILLIPANDAFADHPEVAIVTVDESGFSQTCAEAQGGSGCYTPVTATVEVGGVVTMTNTDPTGVHTFTSGTVDGFAPSPDGTFDTGVLMSGDSFEWTPTVSGEYPYYCMLHTWMVGTIVVQEAESEDIDLKFKSIDDTQYLPAGSTGYIRGDSTFRVVADITNDSPSNTYIYNTMSVDIFDPSGTKTHSGNSCGSITLGPGESTETATMANLSISCASNTQIESTFPTGTWSYTITIDPSNELSESDETNNVHTGTFRVCTSACMDGDLKFKSIDDTQYLPAGSTGYIRGDSTFRVVADITK